MFDRLRAASMHVKESKCALFLETCKILGHVVSKEGVSVDPGKIEAVKNWPVPTTVDQIQ